MSVVSSNSNYITVRVSRAQLDMSQATGNSHNIIAKMKLDSINPNSDTAASLIFRQESALNSVDCSNIGNNTLNCWQMPYSIGTLKVFDNSSSPCIRKLPVISSESIPTIQYGSSAMVPLKITNNDIGCPSQSILISDVSGPLANGNLAISPTRVEQLAPGETRLVYVPIASLITSPSIAGQTIGWAVKSSSLVNSNSWNANFITVKISN